VSKTQSERARQFDALFRADPDPWQFETSGYERRKRAATLAALGEGRFAHAAEIGCATGLLARDLAPRCDALLAIDVSAGALQIASVNLRGFAHVTLQQSEVPSEPIGGPFDLIMLSEVLYFLSPAEVEETSQLAARALTPGGQCVLVNWTGPNDLPLDGDAAVAVFTAAGPWRVSRQITDDHYRIDVCELRHEEKR
jgi:SAM-dependent methyltransferase